MESNQQQQRYGFTLVGSQGRQDFYAESIEHLIEWLDRLSEICIMDNVKDDYIFSKNIGTGNSCKVVQAKDCNSEKEYAIKTIRKSYLLNDNHRKQSLIREIEVLRFLEHPNIIKLIKVYEDVQKIHLVTEFIGGGELFRRIVTRKKFSEYTASKFMKHLLSTLAFMHELGIVHRDIKPENIVFISRDDDIQFKLIDFGLACSIGDPGMRLRCGSPGYVAPEILKQYQYTEKVDIFSCGIILYILLSGRAPFRASKPRDLLTMNKECKLIFQDEYWRTVSRQAIDLVLNLTNPDPNNRPSAKEALKHPWFSMTHQTMTPENNERIVPVTEIPMISHDVPGPSHELMYRFNKMSVRPGAVNPFGVVRNQALKPQGQSGAILLKQLRIADTAVKNPPCEGDDEPVHSMELTDKAYQHQQYMSDYLQYYTQTSSKSLSKYKRKLGIEEELVQINMNQPKEQSWTGYSSNEEEPEVKIRHDSDVESSEEEQQNKGPTVIVDEDGDLILERPKAQWIGAKLNIAENYVPLPESEYGKNSKTVYRDETGRVIEREQKEDPRERARRLNREKINEWSGGIVQQEMAKADEQRLNDDLPFSRYQIDRGLDSELQITKRFGDPIEQINQSRPRKRRKETPQYTWINRFGILPGKRWDGVDRSNKFEVKYMEVHKIT